MDKKTIPKFFKYSKIISEKLANPAIGQDMMLAPRKVLTFKCSGKLRERVNG
jgi:integration host factor subunit alpha